MAHHETSDLSPIRRQTVFRQARERGHTEVEPAIPAFLSLKHEINEQDVHHAICGGTMPHQIHGDLATRLAVPDRGESDDLARLPDYGVVEPRNICIGPEPDGEAFLANALVCKPRVRNRLEVWQMGSELGGRDNRKLQIFAFGPTKCLPPRAARTPLDREVREVDLGLLAKLHKRKSSVETEWQKSRARLIEHGPAGMGVDHLDEPPQEIAGSIGVAYRIPQGNPALASDAVHEEGVAGIVREKLLVSQVRQIGLGAVGAGDDGCKCFG